MRDHIPLVSKTTQGLYDRSSFDDAVPADHLIIANNVVYGEGGVETRPGTSLRFTVGSVRRFFKYTRLNEVVRFLILDEDGNLYDSTDLGAPILAIPEMVDFSAVQYFNNIYITPHNRNTGIENQHVYIYDGTDCRLAGGSAPSGTLTAANSSLSGNVDAGTYLIAVAFETSSGFITKPGPALYAVVAADGTHQIDVSGIPIGPSGTVARRLLATRRIPSYAGNQEGYELFFIPDGRIANNTDTTATVNFYSANLLLSADYLIDQIATIPAGVGIGTYQDSLVIWGEYNDPSVVRISKQGDPESFDAVDGLLTVAPNDSGGVKNCVEHRDSLYIMKGPLTFITARDYANPDSAAFWKVPSVDTGVGTQCFGVSKIKDRAGPNRDNFLVAANSGIYLFDGLYNQPEITWKIASIWPIDEDQDEIQLINDVDNKKIYCLMPDSTILVGDFQNGLAFGTIRWSIWTFPWNVTAIGFDTTLMIAGDGNIWEINPEVSNDNLTAIQTKVRYGYQSLDDSGQLIHVHSVRLRANGSGTLLAKLYGLDDTPVFALRSFELVSTPGKELYRLTNLTSEKVSLELWTENASERFKILNGKLFAAPVWMERPSES